MFRASTILRELAQSLAKVTLLLKHSLKLRRCILCGDVAACREMACALFVVLLIMPANGRWDLILRLKVNYKISMHKLETYFLLWTKNVN